MRLRSLSTKCIVKAVVNVSLASFVEEVAGSCACPWKGESCWVSIVHLLSECIYFRGVSSLRLSRLPIKTIHNALRNLLTTRLSVGCAEQWRRASAHVSVERTLPYQLKAVKLGFIFVTISHNVPRKHFVEVPDGRDARICLFHFPALPFAVLVGGGAFRGDTGQQGSPEQKHPRSKGVWRPYHSVSRLSCQGMVACVMAPWEMRIVVAKGCWCMVAWYIYLPTICWKKKSFTRELKNCFVAWLVTHATD